MLIYDGKEFRNLEEQVRKNKDDISYLKKIQTLLNQFGIHVIGKVDDASQLPGTSDTFGNAFAVGLAAPYEYYIWTDLEPTPGWMNIGIFPAPSNVEGPIGPRGTSVTAATVTDTGYLVLTLTDADNNETQITVGYVKGPQGATGLRGLQGVKGDTGEQGPRGYTGEQGPRGYTGWAVNIISVLSEEAELPLPSDAMRHDAYVIDDGLGGYDLWGLIEDPSLQWANFGPIAFSTNYVTLSTLESYLEDYYDNIYAEDNHLALVRTLLGGEDEIPFARINGQSIIGVYTNFSLATKVELQSAIDALILGTTVVAKSKATESIEPKNENAGVTQETPFICQGTATANNTTSTSVSPIAKQLEKQGNTVVVNNFAKPLNSDNWLSNNISASYSDGVAKLTTTTDNVNARISQPSQYILSGHIYLLSALVKTPYTQPVQLDLGVRTKNYVQSAALTADVWNFVCGVVTADSDNETAGNIRFLPITATGTYQSTDQVQIKKFICTDLTLWYSQNSLIPSYILDHPKAFINYYNGSLDYNEGTPGSSDGQYLVTIGLNQWDEEYEQGVYNSATGLKNNGERLRCKNPIRVIPNTTYYFRVGTTSGGYLYFYDDNNNFISGKSQTRNSTFTTPENACYMTFNMYSEYGDGTTYKHDICINLSWDGERDGEYKPFIKHVYDTGTELLKAYDKKSADGTITRGGIDLDLSALTWVYEPQNKQFYSNVITGFSNTYRTENVICDKYVIVNADGTGMPSPHCRGIIDGRLYIIDESLGGDGTLITGNARVKAENPTTESGTPLANIIDVEDYSVMYWLDSSNNFVLIPQGCKIFYEPDYVGLLDDLGNYTNYDVTALAKKSDLLPKLPDSSNDGTYVLKATKSGSTITYTWEQE